MNLFRLRLLNINFYFSFVFYCNFNVYSVEKLADIFSDIKLDGEFQLFPIITVHLLCCKLLTLLL